MQKIKHTAQAITELSKTIEMFSGQMANILKNINPADKLIEQIQPYYLNPNFTKKINLPTVYRFNQRNMRYYFTINDKSLVDFYPSVTTIIDNTTPTSFGLKKLLGDLGVKGFYQMMKEKAKYGTFLHILISDYLKSGNTKEERYFDLDEINGRITLFAEENNIDFNISDWEWNIKKDLASLIQFIWDYDVEPIAIEMVGTYKDSKYKFAGAIDLICEMTIKEKGFWGETYKSGTKKDEPKETYQERRVTALIDFKSGKSGFFPDHEIQLQMYKIMAEYSLGIKPEKLYNVAPKAWEKVPTYHIKDQTDSIHAKKIPFLLGAFNVEWEEPKALMLINGKINGNQNMDKVCQIVPAKEYVLNKVKQYQRN